MENMRNEHSIIALNFSDSIVQSVQENNTLASLGHVLRLDENRIVNTALHGRVEGTLKRGLPRTT